MSNILEVQNVYDNVIVVQQLKMDDGEVVERVKRPSRAVAIMHDPVNDMVLLVPKYTYGAMMKLEQFPTLTAQAGSTLEATVSKSLEALGIMVKGVQHIMGYMDSPEVLWGPTELYYVTFDSRTVNPENRLLTAKELYQEVMEGKHDDLNVIFGAHYLKMRHHNLVQ